MSAIDKTRSLLDMLGVKAPDIRAWAAAGFFVLTYKAFNMIEHNPGLLDDPAFMTFVGALTSGGILAVANNLFGGTKSGAAASEALAKSAGTGPGGQTTSTTNSTSETSTSETSTSKVAP